MLIATPEAVPYFKAGGLGDAARGLADALARLGHDVRLILPAYSRAQLATEIDSAEAIVEWPGGAVLARFEMDVPPNAAAAVLVRQDAFLRTDRPYDPPRGDVAALARRFAFFCRAVVAYAKAWQPDVIHANDWATGLVPVFGLLDGLDAATVFAIHNLAYQGNFPPAFLPEIGVPASMFRTENGVEFHGNASFMKAGLALADRLVTVSPTYAAEIQTPQYGAGFDGLLRFRHRVLHGILNGIDTEEWDPANDDAIAQRYSVRRIADKEPNRAALLHMLGLEDGGPLMVVIGRLVHQKGPDLLLAALPGLLEMGMRIAVLGSGEPGYERALAGAAARAPRRRHVTVGFDETLARRMYAGADFLGMPSRYEPCGLGQLIAQRYGTPPLARRTGGLADTIEHGRTGFLFDDASAAALLDAAAAATRVWRSRRWNTIRRRCMRLDHSWRHAAKRYVEVYRTAVGAEPATHH